MVRLKWKEDFLTMVQDNRVAAAVKAIKSRRIAARGYYKRMKKIISIIL